MTDKELVELYPDIPWYKPLPIEVPENRIAGLACRLCIAHYGFKARDAASLFHDPDDFDRHVWQFHGTAAEEVRWVIGPLAEEEDGE